MAMSHLAGLSDGQLASAREIAQAHGIPLSLLMNVLKELSAAGYVDSVRGARGGYRLCCRPDKINLSDLISTLERPVPQAQCVTHQAGQDECTCDVMARCPVADPVHRIHRKLNDFLRKLTLAEIVEPALFRQER